MVLENGVVFGDSVDVVSNEGLPEVLLEVEGVVEYILSEENQFLL